MVIIFNFLLFLHKNEKLLSIKTIYFYVSHPHFNEWGSSCSTCSTDRVPADTRGSIVAYIFAKAIYILTFCDKKTLK